MGFRTPRAAIQIDDIDDALRVQLWNTFQTMVLDSASVEFGRIQRRSHVFRLLSLVWIHHFKRPVDTLSDIWAATYKEVREWFFGAEWLELYDFIDFVVRNYPNEGSRKVLANAFNRVLETELSAYRFVNLQLMRITSEEEIATIETAINSGVVSEPYVIHLAQALTLLSDRQNPDYRNSVKESISAVEAACRLVSGNPKAQLADALKILENKNLIHSAFKGAISKLYGWTSDSGGIRHSLTDGNSPDQTDAIFMLVACSAFVNYLLGKTASP